MDSRILTEEQLSSVLRRAQEIDAAGLQGSELEAYVAAAEEAGISRDATMQALRERLGYSVVAAETGAQVFARSADGHYYVAKVEKVEEKTATVRFLNGATATLPQTDLRDLDLTPGRKLNYLSPSASMWSNGTVTKFHPDSMTVDLESWGMTESVSLDKVRILRQSVVGGVTQVANLWAMRLWWLVGGLGIGVLIDRLFFR